MQNKTSRTLCFIALLGMFFALVPAQAQDAIVNGDLGVGISNPARAVHVRGDNAVFRLDRDRDSASFLLVRTALYDFNTIWKTFVIGVDAAGVNNGKFVIKDFGTAVAGGSGNPNRMTIDTLGRVGFNIDTPAAALDVHDRIGSTLLNLYNFDNRKLAVSGDGDFNLFDNDNIFITSNNSDDDDFWLRTTGEQIKFASDLNGSINNPVCFTWYNNGNADADRLMDLNAAGALKIAGTLTESYSFDLAESFWKSDPSIEAGDVVRIDPTSPISVVKANRAQETAVVGVVSTQPGIVMGGSAFSEEQLSEVWGEGIASVFAKEKGVLEAKALVRPGEDGNGNLREQAVALARTRKAIAATPGAASLAQVKEDCDHREQSLKDALEDGAIEVFFEEHFANIAMAGRAPVKVDASYGAISAGDLLVASPTPGHAMRVSNPQPGTVVGKALEAKESGTGLILMLVMQH